MSDTTYKIIRFYQDRPDRTIATGLTLEEAQAHCRRDDTHGDGWFDGYDEENPDLAARAAHGAKLLEGARRIERLIAGDET